MVTDNKNKVPNVPNLRFPEFTNEWEKYNVGELLEFYSTNALSWEQLDYNGNGISNLHYGLIHVGLPTLVDIDKVNLPYIKDGNIPKNYTLCQNGDVAFADASEDTEEVAKAVEFTNVGDTSIVSGLHTIHGRDILNKTVTGFKGYAFAAPSFHNQIRRMAQGTKIYSINSKNFNECHIGIPSRAEQTKIVSLLTLLDERIATQNKIIEDLKSLIKGLNDTIHADIKGKQTSFEDLGIAYSGLSGKNADDFGTGKPYITYLNVYQNPMIDETRHEYVNVSASEKQNLVSYGDLLFTLSSETPEEVGIGSVYLNNEEELYLNSFCFGVHITTMDKVYSPYLAFLVSSTQFRKFVYPLAQGSTRFNLQKNDFMKKKFVLPSIEEQHNIANALSTLSQKVHKEEVLLKHLHCQKTYLLRSLFI